jgi:hypothetical protein
LQIPLIILLHTRMMQTKLSFAQYITRITQQRVKTCLLNIDTQEKWKQLQDKIILNGGALKLDQVVHLSNDAPLFLHMKYIILDTNSDAIPFQVCKYKNTLHKETTDTNDPCKTLYKNHFPLVTCLIIHKEPWKKPVNSWGYLDHYAMEEQVHARYMYYTRVRDLFEHVFINETFLGKNDMTYTEEEYKVLLGALSEVNPTIKE